jgi:fatty-acid peroxygenase
MTTRPSPDLSGAHPIPRLKGLDKSFELLADPYRFIARHCAQQGSDVFEARLMTQRTLFMSGPLAAELFYDKQRFQRAGAAPEPLKATLFGKGAVQTLDGAEHLHRKRFFLSVTTPACTDALLQAAERTWQSLLPRWEGRDRLPLYAMAQDWLARTAWTWAGIEVTEAEAPRRRGQLVALFDSAASGVRAHLRSRRARHRAEAWLGELIENARHGRESLAPDSPALAAALLTDSQGRLLPPRVAAVELLNLVRPITAISVFVVFCAHALYAHPHWRAALRPGRDADAALDALVQEVRRFYPFFPSVVARTCQAFTWGGLQFPAGVRAMLDLYGTNHDARAWPEPDAFRPERFMGVPPGLFNFVPQGGARAQDHHRCPGEGFTLALMKLAVTKLVAARYEVPPQDLGIDMQRLPALPRDRLLVSGFQGG